MKVSLMVTCLGDVFFPNVGVATVRLLRRLGIEVDYPVRQTCCGQPHFNSGFHGDAREIAKHTINAFRDSSIVVTPSGSCAAMVKLEYPELFRDDAKWHDAAVALAAKTHELSALLVHVLKLDDVGARYPGRAVYHMACHLRGLGLLTEPEQLLKNVKELELVPLERFDECCGFGGSFSVRYPEISAAMVTDKTNYIANAKPDFVIATDAGCLMNIGGCLHRRASEVKTVHLAEVLAST